MSVEVEATWPPAVCSRESHCLGGEQLRHSGEGCLGLLDSKLETKAGPTCNFSFSRWAH